jgi:hypothetical protein
VRRKKGRGNVVAEIKKAQNLGVPWRAYQIYLHSGKAALAVMYFGRVRVADRAAVGSIRELMGLMTFILLAFRWMLPASAKTRK